MPTPIIISLHIVRVFCVPMCDDESGIYAGELVILYGSEMSLCSKLFVLDTRVTRWSEI